jgi:hypothetical protein
MDKIDKELYEPYLNLIKEKTGKTMVVSLGHCN